MEMVVQVRLDIPKTNGQDPSEKGRLIAEDMGVQVNRIKVREDVVQVYGSKIVKCMVAKS